MTTLFAHADDAALTCYFRALNGGRPHAVALNIAVSVWFCRCPQYDGRLARKRVSQLIELRTAPRAA